MAEAAGTDGATVDTIYPITGKKYKFMVKHIFWKDHVTNCELHGSLERMPTAIRPYGMEELHYPGMFFVLGSASADHSMGPTILEGCKRTSDNKIHMGDCCNYHREFKMILLFRNTGCKMSWIIIFYASILNISQK